MRVCAPLLEGSTLDVYVHTVSIHMYVYIYVPQGGEEVEAVGAVRVSVSAELCGQLCMFWGGGVVCCTRLCVPGRNGCSASLLVGLGWMDLTSTGCSTGRTPTFSSRLGQTFTCAVRGMEGMEGMELCLG